MSENMVAFIITGRRHFIKLQGGKLHYKNYKGVNPLLIVGKTFSRIVSDYMKRISEPFIGEGQGGFWKARCVDWIYALRQVVEKF